MKIVDLLAVLVTHEVANAAVIHALRPVFRIPDDFVDEIAEMQDEAQPVLFGGALILEDHSPVGVLRAVVCVLATDEREVHRPWSSFLAGAVMVRPTRLPLPWCR